MEALMKAIAWGAGTMEATVGGLESKFKANLDWSLDAGMMMCALAGVIAHTLPLKLILEKIFDAKGEC
jgi:hypothetical protein